MMYRRRRQISFRRERDHPPVVAKPLDENLLMPVEEFLIHRY